MLSHFDPVVTWYTYIDPKTGAIMRAPIIINSRVVVIDWLHSKSFTPHTLITVAPARWCKRCHTAQPCRCKNKRG